MSRSHYVMDYETMANLFVAVFEDVKSKDRRIFICHKAKNDIEELVNFLNRNKNFNEWHGIIQQKDLVLNGFSIQWIGRI